MQNVQFTPPQLARMLSVNESTVKRWIDRGLLSAERTAGGHRRISRDDLKLFLQTQKKVRAHSYVLDRLYKGTRESGWRQYYEYHRDYRAKDARTYVTGSLLACGSVVCVLETIVRPALMEIGAAWKRGDIDIADEHRMTFLIRSDLLALDAMLPDVSDSAPRAVLACVPEDNHELVLVMLAMLAKEAGWQTTTLGINVPAREVVRAVEQQKTKLVALSKVYGHETHIEYVRSIRKSVPSKTCIVTGGSGWSTSEQRSFKRMKHVEHSSSIHEYIARLVLNT